MTFAARSVAFAFSVSILATSALTPVAFAQTLQSYTLENIKTQSKDKTKDLFIPRIEILGTNVSRADVERLLTPDLSQAERAEVLTNMQAQRISIPEVVITRSDEEKGRFVLRDYLVTNLDRARFDRISLGSIEGTMTTKNKADGTFKSGQIVLEGGDFSKVAAAAKAGDASDGVAKLRLFSWSGFEMTVAEPKVAANAPGGNSYRVGLKSAVAKTDYSGDLPTKAVASFDGMYFVAPPSSDAGQTLANFGYKSVEFGVKFDGTYNPAAKTFALNDYSFTGLNAGSLALSGAFNDIDPDTFISSMANRLGSLMKGKTTGMNLRYVDSGVLRKLARQRPGCGPQGVGDDDRRHAANAHGRRSCRAAAFGSAERIRDAAQIVGDFAEGQKRPDQLCRLRPICGPVLPSVAGRDHCCRQQIDLRARASRTI